MPEPLLGGNSPAGEGAGDHIGVSPLTYDAGRGDREPSQHARRSKRPRRKSTAWDRALRLLGVRDRSSREIEQRLRMAGYEQEEINGVLERLRSAGLIDDERFTTEVVQHALGVKRAGRRAVLTTLYARGIGREAAERALTEAGGDEEERADELARLRAPRLAGLEPAVAIRRLTDFLIRRGYEPAVARTAAARALRREPPLP